MEQKNTNAHKYCIAVDGSIFSEMGFDFTLNDLYQSNDKITLVHVTNTSKLEDIPFNFKPEVIISKYETQLLGKLKRDHWEILNLNKNDKVQHSLQQVYELCKSESLDVLIVGHSGHKSTKVSSSVTKGVNFILNYVKIPTFIMRESLSRKSKPAFTWMICITSFASRSYKGFEFATNFIHPEDKVIAVHIRTGDSESEKTLEEKFVHLCNAKGLKNYRFELKDKADRNEKIGKTISDIVNFSNEYVDILVVGKNSSKYNTIEELPAYEIIKNSEANFLFYSC
jgi:hypothetical protein